jgi:hypothetical protein
VEQGGEECPVRAGESGLLAVQLPFERGDLVPDREDLRILVPVTHGEQT